MLRRTTWGVMPGFGSTSSTTCSRIWKRRTRKRATTTRVTTTRWKVKQRPPRSSSAGSELDEWYEAAYSMLVSREDVQRAARIEVSRLMAGGSLLVSSADLEGARPYLRR